MASPLIVSLKKQKNFCGSKIRIFSPAKINLYLNILGKYPGGFHRIESIVERISLKDIITITVMPEAGIEICSNDKSLETKENLLAKAAELIRKSYGITFGLAIDLKKNIPMGSGLGGGSSNAATTLLAMNTLFGLGLDQQNLYRLGAKLGSDVNFFLSQSRFARLNGRGQNVLPLKIKDKFSHFILWPGKALSTREVYHSSKAKLTKFFNSVNIIEYALAHKDISLLKKSIFNALEAEAFKICPELKDVIRYLNERGIFARVTGSGSALYTIGASLSLSALQKLLPSSWAVFRVETF